MIDPEKIETLIKTALPAAQVLIEDLRGDGAFYTATVISQDFGGQPLLQQHRRVYQALADLPEEAIDKMQIKTRAG